VAAPRHPAVARRGQTSPRRNRQVLPPEARTGQPLRHRRSSPYLAPHTWPHDDAKASNILIASLHDPTDGIYMAIELSALGKATGLPEASLAYALPELRDQYADARSMALCGRNIAGRPNYVGLACHRCMAAKGITTRVYVWMRHDQIVCLHHNLWIGPGAHSAEKQLDLAKVPEVVTAQRKHRVLIRRLRRKWVSAVFPRAFEFADSWVPAKTRRQRYVQLRAPRGYPPGKFPFRGAHWNAAIYPETVALTGVLASRPWRSSGLAAGDDESLQLIVQQIRSRVLPGYDPDKESEPIFEWLTLLHDHSDKRAEEVRLYERDLLVRETGTSQGAWKPASDLCDERADSGKCLVHEGSIDRTTGASPGVW
jgi:hypothetical protein